jgi:hypothetical protein
LSEGSETPKPSSGATILGLGEPTPPAPVAAPAPAPAEAAARTPDPIEATPPPPAAEPTGVVARARAFLKRWGHKLWWLHSVYAAGLGFGMILFAQKGFERARWLLVSGLVAWLLVVVFFRHFGSGHEQARFHAVWPGARTRFLVMTYVLKNLYQGMLFFLLPFYWKSSTFGAESGFFVFLLAACALLSTLDLVFDRVLMKWKSLASAFYAITLFATVNLAVPALLPETRTLATLLVAAGVTAVAFLALHVRVEHLKKRLFAALLVLAVAGSVGLAYVARRFVPPVPMYVAVGAVGPMKLPDGRLAMEVKSLHRSVIQKLIAVTDVVVPGGEGDRLSHVWRREGEVVQTSPDDAAHVAGPSGTVRLRSSLAGDKLPADLVGRWTVDVETEDGQLVGRVAFTVTE